ncbi:SIMPL domain-containing protein [Streptomyces sp. 6N223]|uniref:SIMPL domain-containing protein n=1 Tax=Streptomyces sp. 6N223 TaxID=3457412 RepID=UPI003FD5137E
MNGSESIHTPWGVSVFGAASLDAAPDMARLRLAVKETRKRPADAFEVTRGAVTRVRAVLRGHGIPDAAVSTSRLNLRSTWHFGGNERKFAGYECTASFMIEVRDLDVLEAALVDAVEAGANQVEGVEFDVSTKKELRARARTAAVAAAREKAELYAGAAGVRLGTVVHIKDVEPEQGETVYRGYEAAAAPGGDSNLTPGQLTVTAAVVLGFAIL